MPTGSTLPKARNNRLHAAVSCRNPHRNPHRYLHPAPSSPPRRHYILTAILTPSSPRRRRVVASSPHRRLVPAVSAHVVRCGITRYPHLSPRLFLASLPRRVVARPHPLSSPAIHPLDPNEEAPEASVRAPAWSVRAGAPTHAAGTCSEAGGCSDCEGLERLGAVDCEGTWDLPRL